MSPNNNRPCKISVLAKQDRWSHKVPSKHYTKEIILRSRRTVVQVCEFEQRCLPIRTRFTWGFVGLSQWPSNFRCGGLLLWVQIPLCIIGQDAHAPTIPRVTWLKDDITRQWCRTWGWKGYKRTPKSFNLSKFWHISKNLDKEVSTIFRNINEIKLPYYWLYK